MVLRWLRPTPSEAGSWCPVVRVRVSDPDVVRADPMRQMSVGEVSGQMFLRGPGVTDPTLDPLPGLLTAISHAKRSIYAVVFSISLTAVRDALIARHTAGVEVHVVSDVTEAKSATSCVPALAAAGVDVRLWGGNYQEAHDKLALIDGDLLVTGSYNWTNLAETRNIENLFILKGTRVARVAPVLMKAWQDAYDAGKPA